MNLRWVERKVPDERFVEGLGIDTVHRVTRVLQSLELVAEHSEIFGVKDFKAYEWKDVPVEAE